MARKRGYRAAAPGVRGLLGRLGARTSSKAAGGAGMNPLKGGSPRAAWMGDPARGKRRTQTQDPGGSKAKMKARKSQ